MNFLSFAEYTISQTTCTGYGFLIILYSFILFGISWSVLSRLGVIKTISTILIQPITTSTKKIFQIRRVNCLVTMVPFNLFYYIHRFVSIGFYLLLLIAFLVYIIIDTADNRSRLISLSGLCFFLLFGFVFSKYPGNVSNQ